MKKIRLQKTELENGKFIYKAFDGDQLLFTSKPSKKHYQAMMINKSEYRGGFVADHKFGRIDLLGKGQDRWVYESHLPDFVAVLDEVYDLVVFPPKVDYYKFRFKMEIIVATDEKSARATLKRRYQKWYPNIRVDKSELFSVTKVGE